MEVPVALLRGSRVATTGTHLPLRKLALCLDCDECFEVGAGACPVCSSRTWSPLARFIDLLSEPRTYRHASDRKARRSSSDEKATGRYLLVVARHQRELYENIRRALAGPEKLQVILDRRVNQRRQGKGSPMLERRTRDRRSSSAIDEQLERLGWALVPLEPGKPRR